jgi:hypothetical protein
LTLPSVAQVDGQTAKTGTLIQERRAALPKSRPASRRVGTGDAAAIDLEMRDP